MKKKVVKILAAFVLIVLVLYVLLHTPPVRKLVMNYIVNRMAEATGADIHCESLDYNLLKWRFTFRNFTLAKKDKKDKNLPPFFKAQQVTVDLPFPFPGEKLLHLQQVKIIRPAIRYIRQQEGEDNFPFPSREASPPEIPPFIIEQFHIDNGRVLVQDQVAGSSIEIPAVDSTLDWLKQTKHTLSLKMLSKGNLRWRNRDFPINGFSLEAVLDHRDLELQRFQIRWAKNSIQVLGNIKNYVSAAPDLDITLRGNVFTGAIAPLLPLPYHLQEVPGALTFNCSLRGPLPEPVIAVHLETNDLLLSQPIAASASGSADFSLKGFSPESLKGKGNVIFRPLLPAQQRPLKKSVPLEGEVAVELQPGQLHLDIRQLKSAGMGIDGKLVRKGGRLSGNLVLEVPDIPRSLRRIQGLEMAKDSTGFIGSLLDAGIEGGGVVRAALTGTPETPQVTAHLKSHLRMKQQAPLLVEGNLSYAHGILRCDPLHIGYKQGHLHLAGIFPIPLSNKNHPTFTLRGETIDTASLLPFFGSDLPFRGVVSFTTHMQINPVRKKLEALVEQLELEAGGQMLKTRGPFRFALDTAKLAVENLGLVGTGTSLRASGDLLFTGRKDFSSRPFTIGAGIDGRLLTALFPSVTASGQISLEGEMTGTLSQPIIKGQLDLAGGSVALTPLPAPFENIAARINLSGETITINTFTFDWQGGRCSLTGKLPFSSLVSSPLFPAADPGKEFSLALSLRDVSAKMIEPLLPAEWVGKVSGSLEADFQIHGKQLNLAQLAGSGGVRNLRLDIAGYNFRQPEPALIALENGTVTVETLTLTGPDSYLRGKGRLQLTGKYPLDLELNGEVHSRILQGLWEGVTFSGTNVFHFRVKGDLSRPDVSGEIAVKDGGIQHMAHHLYITGLNGKITLQQGNVAAVEPITGSFNGGKVEIKGGKDWTLTCRGVQLDVPLGLLWEAAGTLTLEPLPTGGRYRLRGSISLSNGLYKEPFNIGSRLYRYFHQPASPVSLESGDAAEVPLDFAVNLYTETPIRVENNMAKGELAAALTLTGSYANPVLAGRADIKEGGEIYLGKNTFYIERGTVNFINPYQVEPELDIRARTQVSGTGIRLSLGGTPRALSASLSSTPPLPEPHIIALLTSGKPMDSTSPSMLSAAGNRALSYLGSTVTGKLEGAVKRTLGLETVRIDGSLVAARENPGARFTLGHHLTPNLGVILSQSLRQSQNRTWIVNYDPFPGLNLQAARQDNNAYNLGVNHDIQWGLKESAGKQPKSRVKAAAKRQKIAAVVITGDPRLPEQEIRKRLRLKKGKPFRFFQFQQGLQRLRKLYYKKNYLSVEITSGKESDEKAVKVVLDIDAGPRVFLDLQGAHIPRRLHKTIKNLWIKGHTREQRIDDIIRRRRLYFFKKRYYRAAVRIETVSDDKEKTHIVFHIDKGSRFNPMQVEYGGNHYTSAGRLTARLKKKSLLPFILIQPEAVIRYLEQWYRQEGFLAVTAAPPQIQWQEKTRQVKVKIVIAEGERFRVGDIQFKGNRFLDNAVLANSIAVRAGDFFSPQKISPAALAIESLYAARGFHNTRVMVTQHRQKREARVQVSFTITEKPRLRIRDIRIRGNHVTRGKKIQRELLFKTGDILDLKAVNETRKRLYDLGIFERITIDVIPGPDTAEKEGEQPCAIDLQVIERKPYQLKYGVQLDSESSLGIAGELLNVNVKGNAALLGASFRLNKMERDLRLFSRFPHFPGKKITGELFLFNSRKKETSSAAAVQRSGFTLQQQLKLTRQSLLSVSYTFERYQEDAAVNLGHLTAAYSLDTRDSFLNTSRGLFFSQSVQYAGKFLGSRVEFFRYLGQMNIYKRISPRWVSATSLHLGLGKALGQRLLTGERFFAGGGSTIRGFKHNSVGPIDPVTGEPEGGEALLIFKQELRYRLSRDIGAVFFLDLGNIYPVVSDLDPFDIRKAAGFGLRFQLFGLLLRMDWGFKLDRRPGESPSHIFFSIGQSF